MIDTPYLSLCTLYGGVRFMTNDEGAIALNIPTSAPQKSMRGASLLLSHRPVYAADDGFE
jgi:hypothetical protein